MANRASSLPSNRAIVLVALSLVNFASCADLQNRVCKSAGCIEAAALIQKNMDTKVDPCDNFYNFACGKFMEETVIPEDKASVSLFAEKTDKLQQQLKKSIEMEMEESDPKIFKLAQSLYNTCMDTEKMDKTSNDEVKAILSKLGNWPVVTGESWSESSFDWQKFIYQLRELGYGASMDTLLSFYVGVDDKNTVRRIITVDQAGTGLTQEYLSKGLKEPIVKAYYKYLVDLAVILGAERKQAEKELAESLNFEIELAKISLPSEERRNMSALYNIMTVEQLQSKYEAIPWVEYFNKMLAPKAQIELTDEVNVIVPSFLEKLPKLLAKTPKRVLANYMLGRVVQQSAGFMNEEARDAKREYSASISGTKVERPRWTLCVGYLSSTLPQAIGALYVRTSFNKDTKAHVEELVKELRKSFDGMLEKIDWMDSKTKKAAQVKLNAVQEHVAYPDEFLDDEKLDKYFENLSIDPSSFLKSHLQTNLFHLDHQMGQLRKPVDKTNWVSHGVSAIVNAFYAPSENSIQIPAGILQGEFFTSTRPSYMNYASVGWIIGHEFTHGFDDQGSQFDNNGNLANWWDVKTKKEYLERAQCMIDQYSNYTVKEIGLNINGRNTQGENIADNGGIKEAYIAYENFEKRNGQEPRLPGLSYSPRQMFWISAANVWCGKLRPQALKNRVITDVHSPAEFRVVVPFSNMPQFAKDFNCPVGSPMNPAKKCTVW